jgi:hypothetical protein
MFIYFFIINSIFQSIFLYYNVFYINNIFNFGIQIIKSLYFNIFKNNNNYNNNIIVKKFIKNIYIELKPILLILQFLNENDQFYKFKELENKYPHISYLFPLKKNDDINKVIHKYLLYINYIYR